MLWKLWCKVLTSEDLVLQDLPSGAVTSSAVSWWASESACRQAVKPRYLRLIPNVWVRQLEVGRFWKQRNCHLGILGLEILKVQSHFGQLAYTAYTVQIVILCTVADSCESSAENDRKWHGLKFSCHEGRCPWRQVRSDTHGPEMSRRSRDCCRVPDLFVMQQPLAQLLTIGLTTISIPQSIHPRCQIMLYLLCFNNQQRLMMLMKKMGFGCPVPGLAEVLGSPRTCARRWCEGQQSSNIFLDLFGVFSQVVPKKTPQKMV